MDDDAEQNNLAKCLEKALLRHNLKDRQLHDTLILVLHRSVEYGRANRVLGDEPTDESCDEYAIKVITYYEKNHDLIACLEKGDPESWTAIMAKIQGWANGYMRSRQIYGRLREISVAACATNSAMTFLSGVYHYDTNFDAWLCVLVQNVCRKYIKEQLRPNIVGQNEALSYNKFDSQSEQLADKDANQSQRLWEIRTDLLDAIEKLSSENRKKIILFHYFYGQSFKEIAAKMNKSMNAIYKLHFDALNDLRNNLDK